MFSDGRCVAYENGEVRHASEKEKADYLSSMVPASKKGGKLDAIRYNEATKSVEARYSFASKNGTTFKTFAKKLEAQHSQNPSEPVDSIQDESKSKENKVDVPRDKAKAKPETKFERPKEVDNPTEVRKSDYGFGEKGKNLHTEVVPRDSGGDGAGGKSVSFEDEKGEDATSGNENKYVQDFTPSEKPTPAGNEDNHAVAAGTQKDTKVANIKFAPETLIGIFNREGEKTASKDEDKPNPFAKKDEKDKDEKKPNPFAKKDDAEKDDEKDEKSEDKGKKASVDEDVVNNYREAKSQLDEVSEELQKAKAELNSYKIREARMSKAIEYVLAMQSVNPEKYAKAEMFLTKVSDTVKKMNVEAIGNAIEEVHEFKRASSDALKKSATSRAGNNDVGIESALVIPRTDEGFSPVNRNDLAAILMANTKLGKQINEFEDYVPHQKSW